MKLIKQTLAFGPDPRQKLDLFRPERLEAPARVLIFWHGGSWRSGDKGRYGFVGRTFARRGYVVIVANYRCYPQVAFPELLEDIEAVMQWAVEHVAAYGGDPRRIYTMGHSAGGHLALLQAYARGASPKPQGVISLAGVTDVKLAPKLQPIFAAPSPTGWMPARAVRSPTVPLLLIHGQRDRTVEPSQSQLMADRVIAAGGQATLRIHPRLGHMTLVAALWGPLAHWWSVAREIEAFIAYTEN